MISDNTKYVLRESTLVVLSDAELYISLGVWNYHSLSIELKPSWKDIVRTFLKGALGDGISIEELQRGHTLNADQVSELRDLLTRLQADGFLFSHEMVNRSIYGSLLLLGLGEPQVGSLFGEELNRGRPRVAILTNISKFEEIIPFSRYERWLDLSIIDVNNMPSLRRYDATERTSGTEAMAFLDEHKLLAENDVVGVILNYADPMLLRNLNRIFLRHSRPWVFCTTDGPFVMLTSFIPEQSGCFECLELRMMAQMRSMQEYKSFVSLITQGEPSVRQRGPSPIDHLLVSLAMNEVTLLSGIKASHFVGRLLSIYMPFFEIQMQDVLRLPICPACGETSKASLKELNFDFRRVIADIVSKFRSN